MSSEKKEDRFELEEKAELIMDALQIIATVFSLLAGLMFTASVLFFSLGKGLPYGDLFTLMIMTNSLLFVFGILTTNYVSHNVQEGFVEGVERWNRALNTFGNIGILLMMVNLIFMALYLRWEFGVIMFVFVFLCWTYVGYNFKKLEAEIKKRKAKSE